MFCPFSQGGGRLEVAISRNHRGAAFVEFPQNPIEQILMQSESSQTKYDRPRVGPARAVEFAWATALVSFLVLYGSGRPACAQIEYDLSINHADFVVEGVERYDYTGQSLGRGDFNGDGLEDLIVPSFLKDGPSGQRTDSGMVRVYFGSPPESTRPGVASSTFYGAAPGDKLGLSVTAADLNGDSIDDLVLSASGIDGPDGTRSEAGGVVVFFGRPAIANPFPPIVDLAVAAPDLIIYGPDADDSRGGAFQFVPVAIGDIDGDLVGDLLIGFPGGDGPDGARTDAGELHVVFGGPSLPTAIDLASDSDVVVYGEDPGDLLGVAAVIGNFNGDAHHDIVGGAKNAAGPLNQSSRVGEAVGICGHAALPAAIDLGGADTADFVVYGIDAQDRSSRALACGDMNGDNIDDLLIGARHADGASNTSEQESAGDAYVFLGDPALGGEYFLAVDAAMTVYGKDRNDSIGYQLAIGDVNGDGFGDLVTSGQFGDGPANRRTRAGEVVVVLGGSLLPSTVDLRFDTPAIRVHGARYQDSLGTAVGVCDWNNDGIADLLLGSTGRVFKQLDTPPLQNEAAGNIAHGAIWVLHGGSILARLTATPAVVKAGDSFELETWVSNTLDVAQSPTVTINWLAPDQPVEVLKQKTIQVGAGQARRIPRFLRVARSSAAGRYGVEIVVELGGTTVDRDVVFIDVERDG